MFVAPFPQTRCGVLLQLNTGNDQSLFLLFYYKKPTQRTRKKNNRTQQPTLVNLCSATPDKEHNELSAYTTVRLYNHPLVHPGQKGDSSVRQQLVHLGMRAPPSE